MGVRKLDYEFDNYNKYNSKQLNNFYDENDVDNQIANNEKKLRRKAKRINGDVIFKVFSFSIVLVIFTICVIILNGYASLNSMQQDVIKLEKYKKDLIAEKAELNSEIDYIKVSSQIQEEAKYKLGMIYPEESQIVYVSIGGSAIKESEDKKANGWMKLLTLVMNDL